MTLTYRGQKYTQNTVAKSTVRPELVYRGQKVTT